MLFHAVVSVGFSTGEARLALRAHEGNVAVAVAYLMDKREVSPAVSVPDAQGRLCTDYIA